MRTDHRWHYDSSIILKSPPRHLTRSITVGTRQYCGKYVEKSFQTDYGRQTAPCMLLMISLSRISCNPDSPAREILTRFVPLIWYRTPFERVASTHSRPIKVPRFLEASNRSLRVEGQRWPRQLKSSNGLGLGSDNDPLPRTMRGSES